MKEIKFKIRTGEECSMKLYHEEPFSNLAYFVVQGLDEKGQQKINVNYLEMIPILGVDKHMRYENGLFNFVGNIKTIDVVSQSDLEKQVKGYLSLLEMTKGKYVTLIELQNPENILFDDVVHEAYFVYKGEFYRQWIKTLETKRPSDAFLVWLNEFPIFSFTGIWRRLKNELVIGVYADSLKAYKDLEKITANPQVYLKMPEINVV